MSLFKRIKIPFSLQFSIPMGIVYMPKPDSIHIEILRELCPTFLHHSERLS